MPVDFEEVLGSGGTAGCESTGQGNHDTEQFVMCVTKKSCLNREKISAMLSRESRVLGLGWKQVS